MLFENVYMDIYSENQILFDNMSLAVVMNSKMKK